MTQINIAHFALAKFFPCAKMELSATSAAPQFFSFWYFVLDNFFREITLSESLHPAAPHHLPAFITAPGDTDILMLVVGIILLASILFVGNIYLQIHSLPDRMAHKSQKLQFEIVAVLCLLALFTHNHLFWVIALLLALVDLPDFSTPLRSIAGSVQKMAGIPPEPDPSEPPAETTTHATPAGAPDKKKDSVVKSEESHHA